MKPAWVVTLVVLLAAVSGRELARAVRTDAERAADAAHPAATYARRPALEPALGALAPVIELVRRDVAERAVVFTATEATRPGLLAVHVLRSLAWPRRFVADGTFGPGWDPGAPRAGEERWMLELDRAPRSREVLDPQRWELASEGPGYLLWRER